ncbi:MAG: NAD(P)-dependent oxidoreductase [Dehalococcoidia bacterium]|nr:NAD(P)-dependent oxidoreductase [Dehalococcoidia bacterium]
MPLDELLRTSDVVSVHVDLNEQTHHLLSTEQFAQMQPHAYFINTSRGPVVDQAALTAALKDGKIAGAGIDVFEVEPVPEAEELLTLPNVIPTPHMATATEETRTAMRELAVENLLAGLRGEQPPACVNREVLGKL